MYKALSTLLLLLGAASGSAYTCIDVTVPITVTAASRQFTFGPFQNSSEAVNLLLEIAYRNAPDPSVYFKSATNITETFSIATQYCTPSTPNSNVVQILSHGLGFDKAYWSWGGPDSQYNYARYATAAGYATLAYDRLGCGNSSSPDPYTIIQADVETAILIALTERLRQGAIHPSVPKAQSVVHVGHSYGSELGLGVALQSPELFDGQVLTGFSTNATWQPLPKIASLFTFIAEDQPHRFVNYSSGYLTWKGAPGNQFWFFHSPNFDYTQLEKAESGKWPFTVGEALTSGTIAAVASQYTKPTLILAGQYDLIFCGGDCSGVLEQGIFVFPKASVFETYVQPDTGHGLNLHYNATGTYRVVTDFIGKHVA